MRRLEHGDNHEDRYLMSPTTRPWSATRVRREKDSLPVNLRRSEPKGLVDSWTVGGLRASTDCARSRFSLSSRFTTATAGVPPLNPESLYPYGTALADLPGVRFGGCGVQLFFVISGFVIAMTLDRRKTPREFVVRRYARLAPAMLLFERHDSDEYKRAGHCGRSPGTSLERDFQSVGPPAMANTRRRGY